MTYLCIIEFDNADYFVLAQNSSIILYYQVEIILIFRHKLFLRKLFSMMSLSSSVSNFFFSCSRTLMALDQVAIIPNYKQASVLDHAGTEQSINNKLTKEWG